METHTHIHIQKLCIKRVNGDEYTWLLCYKCLYMQQYLVGMPVGNSEGALSMSLLRVFEASNFARKIFIYQCPVLHISSVRKYTFSINYLKPLSVSSFHPKIPTRMADSFQNLFGVHNNATEAYSVQYLCGLCQQGIC